MSLSGSIAFDYIAIFSFKFEVLAMNKGLYIDVQQFYQNEQITLTSNHWTFKKDQEISRWKSRLFSYQMPLNVGYSRF